MTCNYTELERLKLLVAHEKQNCFELGYDHGKRDALYITPITKNAGFWMPIGMLLGYGLHLLMEALTK